MKTISFLLRISSMKNMNRNLSALKVTLFLSLLLSFSAVAAAQKNSSVSERNIRAEMNFLAGDAMQGRGSGTIFERVAAEYIGSQFMQFGLEPAGEKDAAGNRTYVQTVEFPGRSVLQDWKISGELGNSIVLGKDIGFFSISSEEISGELQKLKFGEKAKTGAIVLLMLDENDQFGTFQDKVGQIFRDGATAVLMTETKQTRDDWAEITERKPALGQRGNLLVLSKNASEILSKLADGTKIEMSGTFSEPQKNHTWNAIGKITGSDPKLAAEVVLLTSHLDHLGVRQNAPGDDKIFNGADDDASGTIAVLELARTLGADAKHPKRTVYFVCFGSEEAGGFGANYFVNNLPFPKENLAANLEFEMIGRPDEKVKPDELWLTGYDLSNLGAELAKRGAKIVADPHPEQNFFRRSDNYTLAKQGIVAHTVSSFGLHTDYHHASDEIKNIDFTHMTGAINSMIEPVRWLVNSDFKPAWYEGKKP